MSDTDFPAYKLARVSDLIPYSNNARVHSDEQVEEIARSIEAFGFINPIITWGESIVAGHGRLMAAQRLGLHQVPTIEVDHLTTTQRRAYTLADNRLAQKSSWDEQLLSVELRELNDEGMDISLAGFDLDDLGVKIDEGEIERQALNDADAIPEVPDTPVTQTGEVWVLNGHRVMCGDSTKPEDVATLMAGAQASLLHADPPYGMGKASDGVANDNLYREKLDAFQMAWWQAFRPHLTDKASAYIWGNAADLWRLWYVGGLRESEHLELRNELVWDKATAPGMRSELLTQYVVASERCLFIQFGPQFVGNINADQFPDAWANIQGQLAAMAYEVDLTPRDVRLVCGVGMFSHWFTRSQFTLIPEKHYQALAEAYPGYFTTPWQDLHREWVRVSGKVRAARQQELDGARSYFDNAHEIMRDTWQYERVVGSERFNHATPKPVAMMERVMKTSLPPGGLCAEPFGGTGATLMGADRTGRLCYAMELQPQYCDVIVKRWQDHTGQTAYSEMRGQTFEELSDE